MSICRYKADCYSRDDGCVLAPTEIRLEADFARPTLSNAITEIDGTFIVFASSMFTYFRKKIKYAIVSDVCTEPPAGL